MSRQKRRGSGSGLAASNAFRASRDLAAKSSYQRTMLAYRVVVQSIEYGLYSSFQCFFFQAEDGIRDTSVTGVQTCALPIYLPARCRRAPSRRDLDQPEPRLPRARLRQIGRASCRERVEVSWGEACPDKKGVAPAAAWRPRTPSGRREIWPPSHRTNAPCWHTGS